MDKKYLIIILLVLTAGNMWGQIAQWLIRPQYSSIQFLQDSRLILTTDSQGFQEFWDLNGTSLTNNNKTQDKINPFYEHYAVTTSRAEGCLTGFFHENGNYITPKDRNGNEYGDYHIAFTPQFHNGYLLVLNRDNRYQFISSVDGCASLEYVEAMPFNKGYASCRPFDVKGKALDPLLITSMMQIVDFRNEKGEICKPDDILFISSVNDEGVGVVVLKNQQVYLFNADNPNALTLMYCHSGQAQDKKDKPVKILDKQQVLNFDANNHRTIRAKVKRDGQDRFVTINLNEQNAIQSIQYTDSLIEYKQTENLIPPISTQLTRIQGTDENNNTCYGINWNDTIEVLPPQFREVSTLYDDKALVRLNDQWGLLKIHPNKKFTIVLNDGKDIGFTHNTFDTEITLITPAGVGIAPAKSEYDPQLTIINGDEYGCRLPDGINRLSAGRGDGDHEGRVKYKCELSFPEGGFDEAGDDEEVSEDSEQVTEQRSQSKSNSLTVLPYKAQVEYQQLKSPVLTFEGKAYHSILITPRVREGDYTQNGSYYFELELQCNEITLPRHNVKITVTDKDGYTSENAIINGIGSSLLNVEIPYFQEGDNTIHIIIEQEGTPGLGSERTFVKNYSKPQPNKVSEKRTYQGHTRMKRIPNKKKTVAPTTQQQEPYNPWRGI